MDITLQCMAIGMFLCLGVASTQPEVPVERFFGQLRNGDSNCFPYEVCGTIFRFTKTRQRKLTYHERHITGCTCTDTPCTVNATEDGIINGLFDSRTIQEVVCQPLNEMRYCDMGEIARAQIDIPFVSSHFEIYCKCEGHFRRHFGFDTATEPAYPSDDELMQYPYPNLQHAVQLFRCSS